MPGRRSSRVMICRPCARRDLPESHSRTAFTDRRNHRARVGLVRPAKPAPTALDRVHPLMRRDVSLSHKSAEARVKAGADLGDSVTANNDEKPENPVRYTNLFVQRFLAA
jgi:hypothetical protein